MGHTVLIQKTAILKLHSPSASKRRVLDLAFARYGEAYNLMLERCRTIADTWVRERVEGKRARALSPFTATKEIRHLLPQSAELKLPGALRDGLHFDVAGNLTSYCELRREWEAHTERADREPQYPSPVYGYWPDAYYGTLAEAVAWSGDPFDFVEWQSRLLREAREDVRPLLYMRASDFNLVRLDNGRWGVTLPLQPRGHEPTKLRFPLAFGEWHQREYLDKGTAHAARLCRREGEYYLHVSFEFEIQAMARGEEQSYLGVDRGVLKQAAYGLVDLEGKVQKTGSLGRELRDLQITLGRYRQAAQKAGRSVRVRTWQRRHQEEMLHHLGNDLVGLASGAGALLVMEELDLQTGGAFVRSQYAKLKRILDYKLLQGGLLPPREVFAAYSSVICSRCGEDGTRGDPDREHFHCEHCGAIMDADENAAVNIARRVLYRKAKWERRGGYRAFHRSFVSVG